MIIIQILSQLWLEFHHFYAIKTFDQAVCLWTGLYYITWYHFLVIKIIFSGTDDLLTTRNVLTFSNLYPLTAEETEVLNLSQRPRQYFNFTKCFSNLCFPNLLPDLKNPSSQIVLYGTQYEFPSKVDKFNECGRLKKRFLLKFPNQQLDWGAHEVRNCAHARSSRTQWTITVLRSSFTWPSRWSSGKLSPARRTSFCRKLN